MSEPLSDEEIFATSLALLRPRSAPPDGDAVDEMVSRLLATIAARDERIAELEARILGVTAIECDEKFCQKRIRLADMRAALLSPLSEPGP